MGEEEEGLAGKEGRKRRLFAMEPPRRAFWVREQAGNLTIEGRGIRAANKKGKNYVDR